LSESDDEWRHFCDRIGWQQPDAPQLPDDYEDQLAGRIFDVPQGKVVPLGPRELDRFPDDPHPLDLRPAAGPFTSWGWWTAAMILALVLGFAVLRQIGAPTPPAAKTVPTPVPEVVAPPAPTATEKPNDDEVPDPGAPLARRLPRTDPAPTRWATVRMTKADAKHDEAWVDGATTDENVATTAPAQDTHQHVSFISPDPEPGAATAPAVISLPAHPFLPPSELPRGATTDSRPLAPTWKHLAMTPPAEATDRHAMAVVDVVEAGRQLGSAL
jgi:hypothetical protein